MRRTGRDEPLRRLRELAPPRRSAARRARVDTLAELRRRIGSLVDSDTVADVGLRYLCEALGAAAGLVYLEAARDDLQLAAAVGMPATRIGADVPGVGPLLELARMRLDDFSAGAGVTSLTLLEGDRLVSSRTHLVCPIVRAGAFAGCVILARAGGRAFVRRDVEHAGWLVPALSAKIERSVQTQAVVREHAIARAIVDSAPLAISLMTLGGAPILRNARMVELLGRLERDEAIGPIAERIERVARSENAPANFREIAARVWADPELDEAFDLELGDGTVVEVQTSPVRATDGPPLARLFVCRDVTAERELRRLQSDVIASVSHELRAPVSNIRGYAALLLDGERPDDQRREFVGAVHAEAVRLTRLLDNLLDLEQLERGGYEPRFEPLELGELLAGAVGAFPEAAERIVVTHPPEPALVAGDRELLTRALTNLVSNAVKYSPAGGKIGVALETSADTAVLTVSDTGIGIAAEELPRVFDRFFRTRRARELRIAGSGIGLSLVHDIVTAHDGEIGCESSEGAGTTFTVRLPLGAPTSGG